ncbi:MAG: iron ABC transporter permease [Treponema sp.]|jgi:iron complex transport system permease protein|nr:iron ABC transporter permease [Treponema sp.]
MQLHERDAIGDHRVKHTRSILMAITLAILLGFTLTGSLALGAVKLSIGEIARIMAGKCSGSPQRYAGIPQGLVAVLWELRLPRIISAMLCGAGLAVSGVIFQALLQNPLADPYTLGISTGAAFGASLAIFLSVSAGIVFSVPLFALAFAALTLVLVLLIAARGGGMESGSLIMSGIIVSAILSAGISFMKMLSGENVGAIVFWLMGSLSAKTWSDAALLMAIIPPASIGAAWFSSHLNILALGSRDAQALGVQVHLTRFLYLLLAAGITAACVSVCGIIGFVGLIVPHLLRMACTADNRLLIPLSALAGGLLLCVADNGARLLGTGEIPVGVLTTLLGGPFFIFMFIRRRTC